VCKIDFAFWPIASSFGLGENTESRNDTVTGPIFSIILPTILMAVSDS
jgi:hypothetical protein